MEKYYVEINNQEYEVVVRSESEAKTNNAGGTVQQTQPQQAQQPQQQQQPVQQTPQQNTAASAADGNTVAVESPMSGSVLSVEAEVGDYVEKDEVVIIIEAMKMETEIFAPASGEIVDIMAVVGNHCKQGEELAVIKETGGN